MNLIKRYCNFINSFLPTRCKNEGGWLNVAAAAITAAGAVAAAAGADDGGGGDGGEAYKIRPKTESGKSMSDMEMLFDENAEQAMMDLSEQIGQWAADDQGFFQNVYQPFQAELMQTNAKMLPVIERTSANALEFVSRNMVSNETLKSSFKSSIESGQTQLGDVMNSFVSELDNLPSQEERVSQAFSTIEGEFGRAGQELARSMAEQGRVVSQASQRDLAIEKAKAKSGAAGVAGEQVRRERREALAQGVGVIGQTQAAQTQNLLGVEGQGLNAAQIAARAADAQVGGVNEADGGTANANIQATLVGQAAQKVLGTSTTTSSVNFTQKGIKNPAAAGIDPETGEFTDEWKAERAAEKEAKRAHELELARLQNQRVHNRGVATDWGGGPGDVGISGVDSMGGSGDASQGDGAPAVL